MHPYVTKVKIMQEAPRPGIDSWEVERLNEFVDGLFSFSKFKEGETVAIYKTPIITDKVAWGWLGYKKHLIRGARGVIRKVDYWDGHFRYDVLFPFSDGTFSFYEKDLMRQKK